jgi:hypothetical protein
MAKTNPSANTSKTRTQPTKRKGAGSKGRASAKTTCAKGPARLSELPRNSGSDWVRITPMDEPGAPVLIALVRALGYRVEGVDR